MNFRFLSAVTFAAAAASAALACSSNNDGGGTGGACQSYANALVAYEQRCTGDIDPSQQSAIAARYAQLCTGALSLPGVPDISSQLSTCASNLGSAACNASTNQVDGCDIETNGTLDDGAACAIGTECKSGDCQISTSGLDDDGGAAPTCGKCKAAVADGADCSNGGVCVTGDTCVYSSQDGGFSGVCQKKTAPGGAGATCTTADDCKSPNYCSFGTNETGTCTAPAASGETCGSNNECAAGLVCTGQTSRTCGQPVGEGGACFSGECAAGLACDYSSNTCAKIQFGAAGATCDGVTLRCSRGECKIAATSGGDGGSVPTTGVCPTIIADGQPCDDTSTTTTCDEFASCVNGTCVLVPAACK